MDSAERIVQAIIAKVDNARVKDARQPKVSSMALPQFKIFVV